MVRVVEGEDRVYFGDGADQEEGFGDLRSGCKQPDWTLLGRQRSCVVLFWDGVLYHIQMSQIKPITI